VLALIDFARAGNSSSTIAVSCSIPVVPGLNAPPYQRKLEAIDPAIQAKQENLQPAVTQEPQAAQFIQETKEKEITLASGNTASVAVETIYVR
jgi:hypothetical protein